MLVSPEQASSTDSPRPNVKYELHEDLRTLPAARMSVCSFGGVMGRFLSVGAGSGALGDGSRVLHFLGGERRDSVVQAT